MGAKSTWAQMMLESPVGTTALQALDGNWGEAAAPHQTLQAASLTASPGPCPLPPLPSPSLALSPGMGPGLILT